MGAARKRRLALIKGGHSDIAKAEKEAAPPKQKLISLSGFITKKLDDVISQRYTKVNPATCPTRWAFIERVLIAGIASFDEEEKRQMKAESMVQLAGSEEMSQIAARLQAAKNPGGKLIV